MLQGVRSITPLTLTLQFKFQSVCAFDPLVFQGVFSVTLFMLGPLDMQYNGLPGGRHVYNTVENHCSKGQKLKVGGGSNLWPHRHVPQVISTLCRRSQ